MSKILGITAREILDSRGIPTIETSVKTGSGIFVSSVPSGRSKGIYEALELRDGGERYNGQGVLKAVKNVNTLIYKKLIGKNPETADEILLSLDDTPNKIKLGANAILSVSMACCRAAALENKVPLYSYIASLFEMSEIAISEHAQKAKLFDTKKMTLPIPSFNVINGGKHAGNKLDIQEYMIMPTGAKTFAEAMQIGAEAYAELKALLQKDYGKQAVNIGDEGGFAPQLDCYEAPLDLIMDALQNTGHDKKTKIAIDAAATTFYRNGKYYLEGAELDSDELIDKYTEMVKAYPIVSIEDPFQENDFDCFAKLNKKLNKKAGKIQTQIVGDDLLCTNPVRLQKAIILDACNCLLLKMNQIGTVTEALDSARIAMKQGWTVQVSHRSGETNDDFIADLAVGLGCGQIKAGAPCRGERLAKYNRILKIEEETKLKYAKW